MNVKRNWVRVRVEEEVTPGQWKELVDVTVKDGNRKRSNSGLVMDACRAANTIIYFRKTGCWQS